MKAEKQQTAVEWLEEQLITAPEIESKKEFRYLIQKAKEMEKEKGISLLEWIRFNANEVPNGWQIGGIYYTDEEILNKFQKETFKSK